MGHSDAQVFEHPTLIFQGPSDQKSGWHWVLSNVMEATWKYVASHYVTLKLDLCLQELCSVPKLVELDYLDEF